MEKKYTERRLYEVCNRYGIHARPAAMMVKIANLYDSDIEVRKQGAEIVVSGKSIMGLMTLEGSKGTKLEITAIGDQIDATDYFSDLEMLTEDDDKTGKTERILKCISDVVNMPAPKNKDRVIYMPSTKHSYVS